MKQLPAPEKGQIPLLRAARTAAPGAALEDLFGAFTMRNDVVVPAARPRERFAGVLVGEVAEREFRRRYSEVMRGQAFTLEDVRAGQNETDYRVIDEQGRPAFRMNIKAHGTFFQQAEERVGLKPEDTFALATYKIQDANTKAGQERLPFLFVVVSSPDLAAGPLAAALPPEIRSVFDTASLFAKFPGGRKIENILADWMLAHEPYASSALLEQLRVAVRGAKWRVISAGKARALMAEYLFARIPALAFRNFAGNRSSQPNMHFSLSGDMIELDDLLGQLRDHGLQYVATKIAQFEV